jgi:hypothetical protein
MIMRLHKRPALGIAVPPTRQGLGLGRGLLKEQAAARDPINLGRQHRSFPPPVPRRALPANCRARGVTGIRWCSWADNSRS